MVTLLILAGCGGSPTPGKTVTALGAAFEVPAAWTTTTTAARISATHGDDLVQVTTFRLAKPYEPSLFDRARPEIERVAHQLAAQLKATTTERTVKAAGEPALQFDLVHDDVVEQVTFVLRGRTEYQLYCRRAKDGDPTACERLVKTFRPR